MFGKRRTLVAQAADADAEAPEAEGARNVGKMGRLVDLSGGDSGMQVI
jgi:hypothetical protein